MLAKLKENTFLITMIAVVLALLYTVNVSAQEKTWLSSGRFELDVNNDSVVDVIFDAKDMNTLYEICK